MSRVELELIAIALWESHARSLFEKTGNAIPSWDMLSGQQRDAWREMGRRIISEPTSA